MANMATFAVQYFLLSSGTVYVVRKIAEIDLRGSAQSEIQS